MQTQEGILMQKKIPSVHFKGTVWLIKQHGHISVYNNDQNINHF